MDFAELVKRNRSYRRFDQSRKVSDEELLMMIEAARMTPSSRNIQPVRYILCNDESTNMKIFPNLAWAGYLTDWDGPEEGERPAAYIIQLYDRTYQGNFTFDAGVTAQTILLQAAECGLGGCIIASAKRENLARILDIDTSAYEIAYVIAIGKPAEKVVLEEMKDNNYKYWRDTEGTHHVSKREISQLIVKKI